MKKTLLALLTVSLLILPSVCLADEKSDAEAAIAEAETAVGALNSLGSWFGPVLILKLQAEEYLKMAREALDAGNYADAEKYAEMAIDYAHRALGMRAYFLLVKGGSSIGQYRGLD